MKDGQIVAAHVTIGLLCEGSCSMRSREEIDFAKSRFVTAFLDLIHDYEEITRVVRIEELRVQLTRRLQQTEPDGPPLHLDFLYEYNRRCQAPEAINNEFFLVLGEVARATGVPFEMPKLLGRLSPDEARAAIRRYEERTGKKITVVEPPVEPSPALGFIHRIHLPSRFRPGLLFPVLGSLLADAGDFFRTRRGIALLCVLGVLFLISLAEVISFATKENISRLVAVPEEGLRYPCLFVSKTQEGLLICTVSRAVFDADPADLRRKRIAESAHFARENGYSGVRIVGDDGKLLLNRN